MYYIFFSTKKIIIEKDQVSSPASTTPSEHPSLNAFDQQQQQQQHQADIGKYFVLFTYPQPRIIYFYR